MHLALPKQKTVAEQLRPAVITGVLVFIGAMVIPVHYPVHVYSGKIIPSIVTPTEVADVRWTQDWRELCPVTVTREFVGSDGFTKTATPYLLEPPKTKGISPYEGKVTIPALPDGSAYYQSKIEPHCPIDVVWQRKYYTPQVPIVVVPKTPAGPR